MVRSGAAGAEVPQTEDGEFESKFYGNSRTKNVMGKMVCYFHTTQMNVSRFTNLVSCFSGSTVEPQAKLIFERQEWMHSS